MDTPGGAGPYSWGRRALLMKGPLSQSLAVAFGSNLGDRMGHFCLAVRGLEEAGIHLEAFSSIFETPPHRVSRPTALPQHGGHGFR